MKHDSSSITIGDRVKIITVPGPVKNIALGEMGVVETEPMAIADLVQVDLKLDDGREITWNLDYLERIDKEESDSHHESDIIEIPLEKIKRDGGTQPRAFMNEETVKEYAQDMEKGAVFPPIVVFYDGENYVLADGFHRVAAAEVLGKMAIASEVKQGSSRDAVLFSCGVNAKHGLRRTNADKRRAVMRMLQDDEWQRWSNVTIAKTCGVSESFVRKLKQNCHFAQNEVTTYTTKHGTVATMNTSNIGKPQQKENSTETPSQPTTVEEELKQKEKHLGLHYDQRTDQVLPDVERNHRSPEDVDDRPGADVAIVKMDAETKKVISAFLGKVGAMDDIQVKIIGGRLVRRYPRKAEVLASTLAGAGEKLAMAAVKSAVLVYPEAVEKELGLGK